MIELTDISKTYSIGEIAVRALQGVTLTIASGEFVAIMGPSGSGKSTLLHVLGLLDRPDSGRYRVLGRDVLTLTDDELAGLRNQRFGFVFQQFHLLQRVTALDNVSLPLIYAGPNGDFRHRAAEKLTAVGLQDRMTHCPNELSGGQQQRVAIARALIQDPVIIFADEPTGNLDSKSQQEILQILKGLNDQGKTVVVVTHDEDVAEFAHRVIRMKDGQIVSDQRQGAAVRAPRDSQKKDLEALPRRSVWQKEEMIVHLRQAVRAITANKVRSFLSMLGILVGVAAVIAMMALGEGAKVSMEESLKSLGSNLLTVRGGSARFHGAHGGAGTFTRFTPRDVEMISGLATHVAAASPMVRGSAQAVYLNENWNTRIEGVDYGYGKMRAAIPKTGRWFTPEEIRAREKVAILGMTVSEKLFGEKNPVGEIIKINRVNFRVVGITPEKGFAGPNDQDDVIYIPVTTAMYRLLGKDYYDTIYIEVISPEKVDEAKTRVEEILRKNHRLYQDEDSFSIRDMSEIKNMLSATTKTMSVLLGCIAAISLFVGGIGIMNIMLVSVTERTREIGLRKAIGARKVDIMMQFLIESVVMTLTGGGLGIGLGAGSAALLAGMAGWATRVSWSSVALATLFSVGVGIGFGLWPARKAAQMNPVEALRYE